MQIPRRLSLAPIFMVSALALTGCKRAGPDPGASTPPNAVVETEGSALDYDACAPYLADAPPQTEGDFMPASEEDLAVARAMAASEQQPRCAHYVFAHQMLPSHVFDDPRVTEVLWADPEVLEFLAIFAEATNEICSEEPGAWQLPVRGFNVGRTDILGRPLIVIDILPPPAGTTEAYLIALVGRPWTSFDTPGTWTSLDHYYVLEHSATREPTHTVFGGWEPSKGSMAHLNMGTGPEPTPVAFLHAVGQNLCGEFVRAKTQL